MVPVKPSRTCCVRVDKNARKFSRRRAAQRFLIGSAPAINRADDKERVWRIERCENSVSQFSDATRVLTVANLWTLKKTPKRAGILVRLS